MKAPFANLERVNLSACPQLSDATLLALATAAPRLVELRIDECRLSAPGISAVAPVLRELRILSMSYVNSVNDAVLVQVAAHCPLLHTVEVESCTAISSAGVATLSQLQQLARLTLNCCFLVTDKAMSDLHMNSRKLIYVDVKGCQSVTPAAIAQLKTSRPLLQVIS